jgi:hypothetical protein
MLGLLKKFFCREPQGVGLEKMPPAGQPRDDTRIGADLDRDDFETESERLRSSNRMIPPAG